MVALAAITDVPETDGPAREATQLRALPEENLRAVSSRGVIKSFSPGCTQR